MITVTIVKGFGATTVRARVTAPSIERALDLAGEGSKVEFPIDPASFFARAGSPISIEDTSIEDIGVEATTALAPEGAS